MRRPTIFVLLALLAASFAAIVVYSALKRRELQVQQAMAQSINIVVAAHDLSLGSRIEPGSIKTVRWSRDSLPPGAITDPASIIGQYTKSGFIQNEPIVADRLFGGDKNAGVMPLLIPNGMRAMSVPVDEVSDIAGFVLPHTHVDVLVSLTEGDKSLSRIVLQDVEVLAVAQDIEEVNDQPQTVHVVTMLVTPEQAERLTLASREGTLRLAMRNYDDKQIVSTAGIDLDQMMGTGPVPSPVAVMNDQPPPPIPRRLAPRPEPVQVEILRDGKSSESVSFVRGNALHGYGSAPAGAPPPPSMPGAWESAPSGSVPDIPSGSGDLPAGSGSMPEGNTSANPLGAIGGVAPPQAAAGIVTGSDPSGGFAQPPAAGDSESGFDGPRSRTVDIP
jgi:pilus assembly protein CpaB